MELHEGGSRCAGRVQVSSPGIVSTVCDNSWDMADAVVVCRQLECGYAVAAPRGAYFGQGSGDILWDDVQCSGDEYYLWECSHQSSGSLCGHDQDASVICSDSGMSPPTTEPPCITTMSTFSTTPPITSAHYEIELYDSGKMCAGRVQVSSSGIASTVCDSSWDMADAEVVCRQLECGYAVAAPGGAYFGQGSGDILWDDVQCSGDEYYLWECSHQSSGSLCGHDQDASVICSEQPDTTTTSTFSTTPPIITAPIYACGGILLDLEGYISSPYYPENYPANVHCEWRIEVKNNFRIRLTISIEQLVESSGCDLDFIEIYDGPLYTSPLLGRICQNCSYVFTSSGNSLSLLFSSGDDCITASGFHAFYSSLSPDANEAVALFCFTDSMEVVISSAYLESHGYSGEDIFLNDVSCRPLILSSFVIFIIDYLGCGTDNEVDSDTIIYTNNIQAYPAKGVTTQQKALKVVLRCRLYQNTMVKAVFEAFETIEINKLQYGRYDVSMSFYDSQSFQRPVFDCPYQVSLNQELYLQVTLHSSNPDLEVFVKTCVASADHTDISNRTYDLIVNGCIRDSTFRSFSSPSSNQARFSFRAFGFLETQSTVYLQCTVVVCSKSDVNSRCRRGCQMRRKRSPRSSNEEVDVIVGPMQLKS
ncbi:deleted in malignant brain tumors 1 protein-like isoform X2 [Ambystoma mexicanum]|uniref:deleted in malignant brain tumors 1 protein-like isoform X2 n=1 Tax=Ambystoma mexicanum TaxID=8296 RepID=UPI0037E8A82D